MTTRTEPRQETIYRERPATAALSDKVHDVIQMLSEKLDCVWRYDKYAEDCADDTECAQMFRSMKEDDLRHITMLRDEIERLCQRGDFK